jgi:hypothetical protein
MPLVALLSKAGLGIGAVLLLILFFWAISALFWGVIGGLLIWNHVLIALFHIHNAHLSFWQAFGVGALLSLFLG